MELYGRLVLLRPDNSERHSYPFELAECRFGRAGWCDIRMQMDGIEDLHAILDVSPSKTQACLTSFSDALLYVDGASVKDQETVILRTGSIIEFRLALVRRFRFDFVADFLLPVLLVRLRVSSQQI